MLSLSLFIQGSLWMLSLLYSIVRNVISVSKVTSLQDFSLRMFFNCHCVCLFHCICLCHCLFVGQVMSPHHSDQKSQFSKFRCRCLVFLLVRSCLLISRIKCLKGHKSLGSLCHCVFLKVSQWVSDKVTYWAVSWTAKNQKENQEKVCLFLVVCFLN